MKKSLFASIFAMTLSAVASGHAADVPGHAAVWQWKLPAAIATTLQVEVAPLKYGKTWAYAVEIDDGPASTLTVSQPLLARYQ